MIRKIYLKNLQHQISDLVKCETAVVFLQANRSRTGARKAIIFNAWHGVGACCFSRKAKDALKKKPCTRRIGP